MDERGWVKGGVWACGPARRWGLPGASARLSAVVLLRALSVAKQREVLFRVFFLCIYTL